jgi:hypothetical protein
MRNNNTTKGNAMYAVFQVIGSREYQVTRGSNYDMAAWALRKLHTKNPEISWILQKIAD